MHTSYFFKISIFLSSLVLSTFWLVGCGSSAPPPKASGSGLPTPKSLGAESFPNLDSKCAYYIIQGHYGKMMRESINMLPLEASPEKRAAVIYWRDIAMLFMGIEVDETAPSPDSIQFDKARWDNLSETLRFQLMQKFMMELNHYVRKDVQSEGRQTEINRLRKDIIVLTQKQQKLEKLLQDLEHIK